MLGLLDTVALKLAGCALIQYRRRPGCEARMRLKLLAQEGPVGCGRLPFLVEAPLIPWNGLVRAGWKKKGVHVRRRAVFQHQGALNFGRREASSGVVSVRTDGVSRCKSMSAVSMPASMPCW